MEKAQQMSLLSLQHQKKKILSIQKTKWPIKNWLRTWAESSLKKKKMAHKYLKICSLSQEKFKCCQSNVEILPFPSLNGSDRHYQQQQIHNKSLGEVWGKITLFTICIISDWCSYYGSQCGEFSKNFKKFYHYQLYHFFAYVQRTQDPTS